MKRVILVTVIIFAASLVSHARRTIAEGETYSNLGKYTIQAGDKLISINGKMHVPYIIAYENSGLEVRVAIDKDRSGKKYYVLSDDLSVQYVSNRHYFGVERLSRELEEDGYKTTDDNLNRNQYFRQKAITTNKNWRRDNIKLIAAYFPMLLNANENTIAAK